MPPRLQLLNTIQNRTQFTLFDETYHRKTIQLIAKECRLLTFCQPNIAYSYRAYEVPYLFL